MIFELGMRQKALIMAGVMLGLLLAALDQTIVATAMPRIIASLGGLEYYSWVVTAYLLASTVSVPVFGKLSDIYGRKPFQVGGIILFLVASVLAGLSQSMLQLVIFRGIQGLGGGVLMANAFSVIGDVFPPAERGKWQGIIGGTFGIASVSGPLLGGFLTEQWSWRLVFYVNVPVGLAALAMIVAYLPWTRAIGVKRSIDYLGVATLLCWTVPLLLTFVWVGDRYDWWSLRMNLQLLLSGAMLALFLLVERRAAEPIVPLALFKNSVYTVSIVAALVSSVAMFGAAVYLPLFLQAVEGLSPTRAGLAMIPMSAGMILGSTSSGQIVSRTGRYKAIAVSGAATVPVALWLLMGIDANTTVPALMWRMALVGLGIGVGMPIYLVATQNALPYRYLGVATSSIQFFRSVGSTVGVAVMGSVLTTRLAIAVPERLSDEVRANTPPDILTRISDPEVLLSPLGIQRVREAYEGLGGGGIETFQVALSGLRVAMAESIAGLFGLAAAISVLAFIAVCFLKEVPLRKTHMGEEERQPGESGRATATAQEPSITAASQLAAEQE